MPTLVEDKAHADAEKERMKPRWVFNGFHDYTTTFDGCVFNFPEGQVVKIDPYKSWDYGVDSNGHCGLMEDGSYTDRLEYTHGPREMVELLLTSTGQNLIGEGCVWSGDREPTQAEKAAAREAGIRRKIRIVEEAQAERNSALARGGKPQLDTMIVGWMKALDIADPIYNKKPESESDVNKLAALLAQLLQQQSVQAKQPGK